MKANVAQVVRADKKAIDATAARPALRLEGSGCQLSGKENPLLEPELMMQMKVKCASWKEVL